MAEAPGFHRRQVIAAGAALLAAPALARRTAQPWPAVQALIDRYVAERKYAGVATALAYQSSPAAFPAAGSLAFDSTVAVDRDSLFRLYSCTKPVTGIAAMLLVEDGRIGLDQPVAEVLPEIARIGVAVDPATGLAARPATRAMTMRQLLTHSSGLSNWQPILGDTAITQAYRRLGITPGSFVQQPGEPRLAQVDGLAEMIARLPEVPLIAEPGTAWHYSMGLDVMGAVIERVSGEGLDAFLRRRLFEPLGMTSTGFQVAGRDARRMTTLYANGPDGPVPVDAGATSVWLQSPRLLAGGGGLVSSARDFIRFATMLLNGGRYGNRVIMKPETAALALSNLLPAGVAYAPTGGFGAGAGVVMPGVVSDNGPVGTFSAIGASSTLIAVEPARRGAAVFLAQYMPGRRVKPAEALRYRIEFSQAIASDLKRR